MSSDDRPGGYPSPYRRNAAPAAPSSGAPSTLADLLERVLDKGVVVAGDVVVKLLDIELLTLKIRLLIASADTAKEMGIDWWTDDPFLSSTARGSSSDRSTGGGRPEVARSGQLGDGEAPGLGPGGLDDLRSRMDRLEGLLESLVASNRPEASPALGPSGEGNDGTRDGLGDDAGEGR